MKKIAMMLVTITMALCLVVMGGCISVQGRDGIDGKDGGDVSIYEIFDATNAERKEAGLDELSFLEFIEEYLSYSSDELQTLTKQEAIMNHSLLSGVSIMALFEYTTTTQGPGPMSSSVTYEQAYAASGVIIDIDKEAGDALIVTNAHEVFDSDADDVFSKEIYMFLYGQDNLNVNYTVASVPKGTVSGTTVYDYTVNTEVEEVEYGMVGKIVGVSLDYDLAVLQVSDSVVIKNSHVYAAKFSDEEVVTVGESVYLVGQPGGNGLSCTSGIISKDSEYITLTLTDSSADAQRFRVIRTDAAINGGNSGGALYNKYGEIIGIVNAKSSSSTSDNLGYALAGSMVKRVVQSMIDNYNGSTYTQGVNLVNSGVSISTINTGAEYDEATGTAVITETVMINGVTAGGLFSSVLQARDYIVSVTVKEGTTEVVRDSMNVTRGYLFTDILFAVRAGDTVEVKITRGGAEQTVTVVCTANQLAYTK